MPRLVDYAAVLQQMTGRGFVSLYPNSGAFGFPAEVKTSTIGWTGGDDPTIRPAAKALTRTVPAPYAQNLATLATRVWRDLLPGAVWVMPKAHWAYELMFGSQAWLPALLSSIDVHPNALEPRHDGSAVEFVLSESDSFETLVRGLLDNLLGSDFLLAWPHHPLVCTVHHHKQLWWTSSEEQHVEGLELVRMAWTAET